MSFTSARRTNFTALCVLSLYICSIRILNMSDDDMIKLGRAFAALGAKPEYTAQEIDTWLTNQTEKTPAAGNVIKKEPDTQENVSFVHMNPRKLPTFSGDENKNEVRFTQWRFEVKCLLRDPSQSPTLVLQSVRSSLRGTAAEVLLHLGDQTSIEQILSKFDIVFGDVLCSEQLLENFYSAKQDLKESITIWGCRIEELLDKIKRSGDITQEAAVSMLRSKFWSGITDANLKSALRHHYDGGESYEALFKHARAVEMELKQQKVKCHQLSDPQTNKTKPEQNDKLDQILAQIKKLDDRITTMEKSKVKRKCFSCGSADHMIKQCPNKASKNEV